LLHKGKMTVIQLKQFQQPLFISFFNKNINHCIAFSITSALPGAFLYD
jgi:hypothetical protein